MKKARTVFRRSLSLLGVQSTGALVLQTFLEKGRNASTALHKWSELLSSPTSANSRKSDRECPVFQGVFLFSFTLAV